MMQIGSVLMLSMASYHRYALSSPKRVAISTPVPFEVGNRSHDVGVAHVFAMDRLSWCTTENAWVIRILIVQGLTITGVEGQEDAMIV